MHKWSAFFLPNKASKRCQEEAVGVAVDVGVARLRLHTPTATVRLATLVAEGVLKIGALC